MSLYISFQQKMNLNVFMVDVVRIKVPIKHIPLTVTRVMCRVPKAVSSTQV